MADTKHFLSSHIADPSEGPYIAYLHLAAAAVVIELRVGESSLPIIWTKVFRHVHRTGKYCHFRFLVRHIQCLLRGD